MFGSQPRTRRPLLLMLVFGAFLVIIGITASAQALMVSLHFSTGTLNTVVASDSATVRAVLNDSLQLRDLDPATGPTQHDLVVLQAELGAWTGPSSPRASQDSPASSSRPEHRPPAPGAATSASR